MLCSPEAGHGLGKPKLKSLKDAQMTWLFHS